MNASRARLIAPILVLFLSCATRPTDLVVTSFSPRPTTDDPSAPIKFRFDRPVVGEDEVGKPLVTEQPIATIEPKVALEARWQDRQTLVLAPKAKLHPSTKYVVTLAGDLAKRTKSDGFGFVHQPLAVGDITGVDPARLPPKPEITLHFNQPVLAGDAVTRCAIEPATGEKIAMTTGSELTKPVAELTVSPADRLAQGKDFVITCGAGLMGAGGNVGLEQAWRQKLHTYPELKAVDFQPVGREVSADEVRLGLSFSTPVNLDEIAKHIAAKPAIRGLAKGWLDDTRTRYTVQVDLDAGTEYEITVRKGTADAFGQQLAEDTSFGFRTGEALPRISMETGIFAVEPTVKGYPVWTRNMNAFQVSCARVPKEKVVKLLTSEMNYDPWYDAGSDKPLDFGKVGLKDKQTPLKTDGAKNKWVLSSLELDKICAGGGAEKRGLYLAELTSKELKKPPNREDWWRFRPRQRVLANVTNLGVLLKAGPASGLVWVTGIDDGKPIAGAQVTVFSPQGKQVFSGASDASGIVKLPGTTGMLERMAPQNKNPVEDESYEDYDSYRAQRMIAVVEKDGDMAVLDGNWQNGIQIWNYGVAEDRAGGLTRIRGFIQSDRGIYRPGEEVHFKGLVRELEVAKPPRVPADKQIKVHVEDARGQAIFDKSLDLTAFGGFALDLTLSPEASLGDYFVTATIKGQNFRERFIVQEFRKVEYEVKVSGEKAKLGQEVKLGASADYLFGAPVANAKVKWTVSRRRHVMDFPKLPEFNFVDFGAIGDTEGGWWGGNRYNSENFVADGDGQTDKQGKFDFSLKDPEQNFEGAQDYLVEVAVTDTTAQTVAKQIVVTAHSSEIYVGMHANECVQAAGMPFAVNTVAVDTDGKQVASKATLSLVRQTPECTYTGGYRAAATCANKVEKIWSRDIEIPATGMGVERIMPEYPGEYFVRLEAVDKNGVKVAASDWVYVLGKGEAFWSGDEADRMSVVAGKQSYQPGETARLVPKTSLSRGTALVTLERNGVLEAWVAPMASSGEGIDVKLTEAYAPNVFASVAVVQGRTGEGDRKRPRFQMGVVDLNVSAAAQKLTVKVSSEKPTYQPGEEVSGTIKVVAADGKTPVKAEVSLSVADEGVLQLIAYQTPDPMKTFYAQWGLGIDSATNWNRIARLNDPNLGDADEGGDGGEAAGPAIRSRFVSSAYWASALVTDDNGEIHFNFKAPDNLTAFRMMAVAADKGARFGSGDQRFTLKKPLLLQPILPRFLAENDHAEVAVVVRNYTGEPGEARVTARAEGVTLARPEQTVHVDKDGEMKVVFPVEVGELRGLSATFTFTAKMGKDSDGLALTIPLERQLVLDRKILSSGKLEGAASVPVEWSADVLAANSYLEVSVDRTGMSDLAPGLRYLIEYPYGCLEQTLSRFIPLVKVKDLADSLDMDELKGPKLDTFVRLGVAKVYRFQHDDGEFSLWMGGETYPHLTVYAMYGLNEAKRAGVAVDDKVVERGVKAVKKWANAKERAITAKGDGGIMAMAAYVLADMGQADSGLNARLYEARHGLPVYGQAFLLAALKIAKGPAHQLTVIEAEILAHLVIKADDAEVHESDPDYQLEWYMSSDARSTAIALSALMLVDPNNSIIDKLVAGVKKWQQPSGRWMNTQDNLFALVALADYARKAAEGSAKVAVLLDGKKLAQKQLSGGQVLAYRSGLDQVKPGTLRLETDGVARYTVRMTTARRDTTATKPIDKGFSVKREYRDPDTAAPLTDFKAGQLVRVHLEVGTKLQRRWVAVVDPLPAGFEVVNTKLATSVHRRDDSEGDDEEKRWWNPPLWTNIELHDDRAAAFADAMDSDGGTFDYLVRATLPGSFTAGPARAEAMYEPEVSGRTASQPVTIKQ